MSRMWWYTSFVLVLWAVNSELRRLYDWKFGFHSLEVLSVLPLVSLAPHVWSLTFGGGWQRLPRILAISAWIWVGGFGYALLLAFISGNLLAGAYTFISFVFPAAIGLWIAADKAPFSVAYKRLTRTLFALTTFVSLYAVIQYTLAPPWDTLWLQNVISQGSTSFGRPAPFQIRVFSTLNSPGPFSSFLAIVLLLSLPRLSLRRPLLLAQMPIWLAAFGLTLVRTGWLMVAAGAFVYFILTPRRGTLLATVGVTAGLCCALFAILPAAIGNESLVTSLSSRLNTLSELDQDQSAGERANLYSQASDLISTAPFGQGLGVLGTSTKLSKAEKTTDFDSGILGRAVEMGIPGFLMYLTPLLLLVCATFAAWNEGRAQKEQTVQSVAAMAVGVAVAFAGQQLGGEASGLVSLLFWLIMCLAVHARPVPVPVPLYQRPNAKIELAFN